MGRAISPPPIWYRLLLWEVFLAKISSSSPHIPPPTSISDNVEAVLGEARGRALVGGRGVVLDDRILLPENGIQVRASELGGATRVELYSRVAKVGYDFFRECREWMKTRWFCGRLDLAGYCGIGGWKGYIFHNIHNKRDVSKSLALFITFI